MNRSNYLHDQSNEIRTRSQYQDPLLDVTYVFGGTQNCFHRMRSLALDHVGA